MRYLRRDYDAFDALGDVFGMHWVDEQYVPPNMAYQSENEFNMDNWD